MKVLLTITASLLLLSTGIGAIYGGWQLINHPDGSSLQLSLNWLARTPFSDYYIPGIILFIANGVLSLFVFATQYVNYRYFPRLVVFQGAVLTGWIIIQMWLMQTIHILQIALGAVGIALMLVGTFLIKENRVKP
jgi:hypothetical protein